MSGPYQPTTQSYNQPGQLYPGTQGAYTSTTGGAPSGTRLSGTTPTSYNAGTSSYGGPTTTYGGAGGSSYGGPTTTYGGAGGSSSYGGAGGSSSYGGAGRPSAGKKQKYVEVIVEKPVIVHKYIDIEEDIIIEKPVERRIEKDVYIEKLVEVPIDNVIEREVENVVEVQVENVVERQVEIERVVEIPVEKIVQVPREVIREVEIKVPRQVEKYVDKTLYKPIETQIIEIPRYVDRQVVQDRVVERKVEFPVDRVVERTNIVNVQKEYFTEVEKVIRVDKEVIVNVNKEYQTYVDKVYTREVEVPVKVDKYVDRPYDVVKEVIVNVNKEYVREQKITIPVDKVVEIPVERIVEIPVRTDKYMDVIYETSIDRPVFNNQPIEIPVARFVDKPVNADNIVEKVSERVVDKVIEVPFGKVIERPVVRDFNVEVFRIAETSQTIDRAVDVPVHVERFVEVPREEYVEKTINIMKVIERPVVVTEMVDRYVDKVVEVRVEVPVPRVVEIPRQNTVDKHVELVHRIQRANIRQRPQTVSVNTIVKRNTISRAQKQRFEDSSRQLANAVIENEKLKAEITGARERINARGGVSGGFGVQASAQENDRLRRQIQELENTLRQITSERDRLRSTVSTTVDMDVRQQVDSQDVPKLQASIQRIRAENDNLRRIAAQGQWRTNRIQTGSRFSHQDVKREAPRNTYGAPTTTNVTNTQPGRNTYSTSPSPALRPSGGYTTIVPGQSSTTYGQPTTTSYGGPSSTTYGQGNTTYGQGNTTYGQGNTTYGQPTTTYGQPTQSSYTGATSRITPGSTTGVRTSGGYTTSTQPGAYSSNAGTQDYRYQNFSGYQNKTYPVPNGINEANLRAAFDKFDTDRSGYLDMHEALPMIKYFYRSVGLAEPADKDINFTMNKFDENKDAKMSYQEFKKMMYFLSGQQYYGY